MTKIYLTILFAFGLFAIACSAPLDDASQAQIIRYDSESKGIDGYNFGFETSDGTVRQEQAELKNVGTEQEALSVRGSFSWVAPDGQTYTVNYVADENGFQPQADHLPSN